MQRNEAFLKRNNSNQTTLKYTYIYTKLHSYHITSILDCNNIMSISFRGWTILWNLFHAKFCLLKLLQVSSILHCWKEEGVKYRMSQVPLEHCSYHCSCFSCALKSKISSTVLVQYTVFSSSLTLLGQIHGEKRRKISFPITFGFSDPIISTRKHLPRILLVSLSYISFTWTTCFEENLLFKKVCNI